MPRSLVQFSCSKIHRFTRPYSSRHKLPATCHTLVREKPCGRITTAEGRQWVGSVNIRKPSSTRNKTLKSQPTRHEKGFSSMKSEFFLFPNFDHLVLFVACWNLQIPKPRKFWHLSSWIGEVWKANGLYKEKPWPNFGYDYSEQTTAHLKRSVIFGKFHFVTF